MIVGGESGPGARACQVVWIRSLIGQCRQACVPVFVKQLGRRPVVADLTHHRAPGALLPDASGYVLRLRDDKGGNPDEWPEDLRVREFPDYHHVPVA